VIASDDDDAELDGGKGKVHIVSEDWQIVAEDLT
jgi:hypothetical protein